MRNKNKKVKQLIYLSFFIVKTTVIYFEQIRKMKAE